MGRDGTERERDLIGGGIGRVEARPLAQPEVERLLLPDVERVRVDDRRLQHLAAREHAPRDGDRALAAVALVHATCPPGSPTVQHTSFTQFHVHRHNSISLERPARGSSCTWTFTCVLRVDSMSVS